jgi:hypothetical protein
MGRRQLEADWLLPAPGFLEEAADIPTAAGSPVETYGIAAQLAVRRKCAARRVSRHSYLKYGRSVGDRGTVGDFHREEARRVALSGSAGKF